MFGVYNRVALCSLKRRKAYSAMNSIGPAVGLTTISFRVIEADSDSAVEAIRHEQARLRNHIPRRP